MNKAVTAVFKMVVGGKTDKYYLVNNYMDMVRVMKSYKHGLITDIEAIKALCDLETESRYKECFKVTAYDFKRLTEY